MGGCCLKDRGFAESHNVFGDRLEFKLVEDFAPANVVTENFQVSVEWISTIYISHGRRLRLTLDPML